MPGSLRCERPAAPWTQISVPVDRRSVDRPRAPEARCGDVATVDETAHLAVRHPKQPGRFVDVNRFHTRGRSNNRSARGLIIPLTGHALPPGTGERENALHQSAEREGFEPPGLVGLTLSRRAHLSALPPFRLAGYRGRLVDLGRLHDGRDRARWRRTRGANGDVYSVNITAERDTNHGRYPHERA